MESTWCPGLSGWCAWAAGGQGLQYRVWMLLVGCCYAEARVHHAYYSVHVLVHVCRPVRLCWYCML